MPPGKKKSERPNTLGVGALPASISVRLSRVGELFSADIAIDLGGSNTIAYTKGKGVILNEPAIVALRMRRGYREVLAVGEKVETMLRQKRRDIEVIRPMRAGVIVDFEVAEAMISYFITRVSDRHSLSHPKVVVCVPRGMTAVEYRAIEGAATSAGASKARLIEAPMVAAIAALPVAEFNSLLEAGLGEDMPEVRARNSPSAKTRRKRRAGKLESRKSGS